jgi:hypothetical protein
MKAHGAARINRECSAWVAFAPALSKALRGTEFVDVIELAPSGPLAAQRVWTGVDPRVLLVEWPNR